MKLFKVILTTISIIIFLFILFMGIILAPYFVVRYFNNKRYIGNEIIIETERLNHENEFIIKNTDNLYGKYHLVISLEPNNINDLRMEHGSIEFNFKIIIKQNMNIITKEYDNELEGAVIGFTPFVIFEMPKDIKYKRGEDIYIIFKEVSIDKKYYKEIKFTIYKSNFKYRTD